MYDLIYTIFVVIVIFCTPFIAIRILNKYFEREERKEEKIKLAKAQKSKDSVKV